MKITDALEGYIISIQAENKSAKTVSMAQWHVKKFAAWLEQQNNSAPQLDDVTPQSFRHFLQSEAARGLRPHSVHAHYKVISTFLRWCIREKLITHDPLQNVQPPKLPQLLPNVLSIEETDKLLKYLRRQNSLLGRRNYLIILTLLTTGLRANELCQLRIEDVHLESQFILVRSGKGGKQRVVPLRAILSKQLWRYLRVWRNDLQPLCDNLFVSRSGLPLDSEGLERMCRRALSKIGAKGGTHILRHTFATLCIQSRLYDLERLRLILGHADLSTTQRYLHLSVADVLAREGEPTPIARLGL